MKSNEFRIKKPYNKIIEEIQKNGIYIVDVNKKGVYPTGYNEWMYMMRKKNEVKSLETQVLKFNKILVRSNKPIKCNDKKSRGKYSYYEI